MNSNSDEDKNDLTGNITKQMEMSESDLTMAVDYDLADPFDIPEMPHKDYIQHPTLSEEFGATHNTEVQDPGFTFNEDEFSDAFDQTLSSTVLALKLSEKARIDHPTGDDLQNADVAVKWLRQNRLEHSSRPGRPAAEESDENSRGSFKALVIVAITLFLLYTLLKRTTWLQSVLDLLQG